MATTASAVVTVLIGLVMAYLGINLIRFGVYAWGEGEAFLGVAAGVLGVLFVAGPAAVVVSQVRAALRARRKGS
jgi:hypothetical protein